LAARGDFIQFLDSDDLLHPEKIERQVCHLNSSNADFIWANCGSFTDNPVWPGPGPATPRVQSVVDHITRGGHVNTVAGIYRRSICIQIGRWREELRVFQDREYNLRLYLNTVRIAYQPDVLVMVRKDHGDRISGGFYSTHFRDALQAYENTLSTRGSLNSAAREALAAVYFSHALQTLQNGHKNLALGSLREASRLARKRSRRNQIKILNLAAHLPPFLSSVLIGKSILMYKWCRDSQDGSSLQKQDDLHGDKHVKMGR
jgi:glycosyltransferase involved in cell wall biosynthesis